MTRWASHSMKKPRTVIQLQYNVRSAKEKQSASELVQMRSNLEVVRTMPNRRQRSTRGMGTLNKSLLTAHHLYARMEVSRAEGTRFISKAEYGLLAQSS